MLYAAVRRAQKFALSSNRDEQLRYLRPQRDLKADSADATEHDAENHGDCDAGSDRNAHDERPLTRGPDSVEAALGEAMLRASRDGDRDLVMAIVAELRARREARERGPAGVVDLAAEREKRGR
jgi:hypothetical protein